MTIPYCFIPEPLLERIYPSFAGFGEFLEAGIFPNFGMTLKQARINNISGRKYLIFSIISDLFLSLLSFALIYFAFSSSQSRTSTTSPAMIALGLSSFLFVFLFMQQVSFPKMIIKKRINDIEKNLLPCLHNILVQLRSGIPLFDVAVNIAASDYGEVSKEFMAVVKQINGGVHQIEAFEKMALENPSHIFRSAVWQLVNGMKTGSELSDVLKEIIVELAEEEILLIEQYGASLSPLTMFYMIGAVILPALGVNFLIVLSAFMGLDMSLTKLIFWGTYGFVLFFQFIFFNIIKSKRPSLLER